MLSLLLLSERFFLFCLLYGPGGVGGGRGGDVGAEDVGAGDSDVTWGASDAGLDSGWGFLFLFCFCLLVGNSWVLFCVGCVFVVCGCSFFVGDVGSSFVLGVWVLVGLFVGVLWIIF